MLAASSGGDALPPPVIGQGTDKDSRARRRRSIRPALRDRVPARAGERSRGPRGRARAVGAGPDGPVSDRRGGQRRAGHARSSTGRSTRPSATLMYAENFYIALYDDTGRRSTFRTTSTRSTRTSPIPTVWEPFGVGNARGTTAYVLRTGKPAMIDPSPALRSWSKRARSRPSGRSPDGDWLGAPLKADGRTIGVVACQTYTASRTLRARGPRPPRVRRAATSARPSPGFGRSRRPASGTPSSPSSTRSARRWRSSSNSRPSSSSSANGSARSSTARSLFIALHDPATDTLSFPYDIDEGAALRSRDHPARAGAHLDRSSGPGSPSGSGRSTSSSPRARSRSAAPTRCPGSACRSSGASKAIGVVGLESIRANAFSEARRAPSRDPGHEHGRGARERPPVRRDEAAARRDGRARQLSSRSSTRSARPWPEQLDFQAIIELVGERVRTIFQPPVDVHRPLRRRHEPGRVFPSAGMTASAAERAEIDPRPGPDLDRHHDAPAAPIRAPTMRRPCASGAIQIGGSDTESWPGRADPELAIA